MDKEIRKECIKKIKKASNLLWSLPANKIDKSVRDEIWQALYKLQNALSII